MGSLAERDIACVTGATGLIGSRIVRQLCSKGYRVRVLSRRPLDRDDVETFLGDLSKNEGLGSFLRGASLVFHCAGEVNNPDLMRHVNVDGTRRLVEEARLQKIRYFCYISSVGVFGSIHSKLVDENQSCRPMNLYEQTKYEAENIVSEGISEANVVIIRPTNVVDERRPGIINLPKRSSLRDLLKVMLVGREVAHVVHAKDVASAALFLADRHFNYPERFIVSIDEDQFNTVEGIWALYHSVRKKKRYNQCRPLFTVPVWIPQLLRKVVRGFANSGDIRYSSNKLKEYGFQYEMDVKSIVQRVIGN